MNLVNAISYIDSNSRIGTNKKEKLKIYLKELFKINTDRKISENLINHLSYLRISELVYRINLLIKHLELKK
jgi:hypothetical protein